MRADGAHRLATFTRPPIDSAPAVRVTGQGGAGAGRSRPPASPPAPTRSRSSGTRRKRRHGRTLERTAKAVRIGASEVKALIVDLGPSEGVPFARTGHRVVQVKAAGEASLFGSR